MDDKTRMRVLHRTQHLLEESQPRRYVEPPFIAIVGERHAVDVLEREIRLPRRRETCVVEARDVRVRELGENIALAREAFQQVARVEAGVRQLESHGALDDAVAP